MKGSTDGDESAGVDGSVSGVYKEWWWWWWGGQCEVVIASVAR